jgi:uncharacterized protein (DUF111 family)
MRVKQIGYGAGSRDFAKHPNVLRVLVGRALPRGDRAGHRDRMRIDDMNPAVRR